MNKYRLTYYMERPDGVSGPNLYENFEVADDDHARRCVEDLTKDTGRKPVELFMRIDLKQL